MSWASVAKQARNAYKEQIGVDPVSATNRLTERQKLQRAKKKDILLNNNLPTKDKKKLI